MSKKILLAGLLISFATLASGENWVQQASVPNAGVFVDTDSFAQIAQGFSERIKMQFNTPVPRRPGQDPMAYAISDVDWNCFDQSTTIKHVADYTTKNELVNQGNARKRTHIQPETWAAKLLVLQCPKAN
jgi:hypothetical protein